MMTNMVSFTEFIGWFDGLTIKEEGYKKRVIVEDFLHVNFELNEDKVITDFDRNCDWVALAKAEAEKHRKTRVEHGIWTALKSYERGEKRTPATAVLEYSGYDQSQVDRKLEKIRICMEKVRPTMPDYRKQTPKEPNRVKFVDFMSWFDGLNISMSNLGSGRKAIVVESVCEIPFTVDGDDVITEFSKGDDMLAINWAHIAELRKTAQEISVGRILGNLYLRGPRNYQALYDEHHAINSLYIDEGIEKIAKHQEGVN